MRKSARWTDSSARPPFPKPQPPVPVASPVEVSGPVRVLSKKEVLERLGGISHVTLWSWIKAGAFPPARVLGPGQGHRSRMGWLSTEVEQWLLNAPRRIPKGTKT
jgi:predicted DNA-binding transcriptional regulator AlpA